MNWYVYMVRCADGSFYTGIATDVHRRVTEHNNNNRLGAKYTRYRRPVELVYMESYHSRSQAAKREYQLRKLPKKRKLLLLNTYNL